MPPHPGFRSLARLLLPFLLIVCLVSGALGWLAWRVLDQDRRQEGQRVLDRLGAGADLVVASLTRRLADVDDLLAASGSSADSSWQSRALAFVEPASDAAVFVGFDEDRVHAAPAAALRYRPVAPSVADPPFDRYAAGEALEYKQNDPAAAAAFFRRAARSSDGPIRAGALVRLARTERKRGHYAEALATYDALAQLTDARLGGLPADLVARHARCSLLAEARRTKELQVEAATLVDDLQQGRWQVVESTYVFYMAEALRWCGRQPVSHPGENDALAIAEGVSGLWNEWPTMRRGRNAMGRRTIWAHDRPVLLAWRSTADHLVAFLSTTRFLERAWIDALQPTTERLNLQLALADADGRAIFGHPAAEAAYRVVRSPAETGLPWTLYVASADARADLLQLSLRRRFVVAAFGLIIGLVALASYATARAVSRELSVARLQRDFVSAVSHEFRTPLASLCQISELLADGRVSTEQRRAEYYDDLRHETQRLQRLVENLLDFGRMEAGARQYRFQRVMAGEIVSRVVEEFGHEIAPLGYRVEAAIDDRMPAIDADGQALGMALWNLLDNAVKYSPHVKTVWVDARRETGHVAIAVRDRGLGVAPAERDRIFDKFVRGESAKAAGVGGTGLGLAMVRQIVAAHGGRVSVTSLPGEGTEFTIVLPARKE